MSILFATLHDAVGCSVTVETVDGVTYRGRLDAVDQATLTLRLSTVLVTQPTGAKDAAMTVTVPGRSQKLVLLPPNVKLAPRFRDCRRGAGQTVSAKRGDAGRGAKAKRVRPKKQRAGGGGAPAASGSGAAAAAAGKVRSVPAGAATASRP